MLIENCLVYTNGTVRKDTICIDGTKVSAIGGCPDNDDEVIDATGYLVVPGMRNLHMHASTSLLRGTTDSSDLDGWVSSTLWEFERDISPKEAFYGSLYSICEMLLCGITYFEDMHFHEQEVARACLATGIRASLSEALMDLNYWEDPIATLESSLSLAKGISDSSLLSAKLGLVSIRLTSEELIDGMVRLTSENPCLFSGFHIHNSEVIQDIKSAAQLYGMTPTELFYKKGVLGSDTTSAHCIHVSERDMCLLAETKTTVATCIASNYRLGSGLAPVGKLMACGVDVGIGIDSPAINDGFDVSSDSRMAALVNRLEPYQALRMLFGSTGVRPNMPADLVFLKSDEFFPGHDIVSTMAYTDIGRHVVHVMVDGIFVVRDREVLGVDFPRVRKRAASIAQKVLSRLDF